MYAVNNLAAEYKICFGGNYKERWSNDYTLSIEYSGRREVTAKLQNGRWHAVDGDKEIAALLESDACPHLTRQYFEAAATAYHAAKDCLHRGLTLDRLCECFHSEGNPLVAPELMRLLMDDCGFAMNTAFNITAHCCSDIRCDGADTDEIYALQPRTAHVVSLLRSAAAGGMISVMYDSRLDCCRRPFGAVCCGDEVLLSFHVLAGSVRNATLIVSGDAGRTEYPMECTAKACTVRFTAPDTPCALWYFFRIETENGTHWICPDATGFIGRTYGRESGAFRLTVFMRGFDTPAWFRRSVMYQIFPDRFAFSDDDTAKRGVEYHRSLGQKAELHASLDEPVRWWPRPDEKDYSPDDFYGGTFKGIEQKLGYLKELGISVLYLNPIVEARSNHRYDTSNYMRPDPILGTQEDFEHLCAEAEKLGIRIVLDGVFSHTGADSVYFNRYANYPDVGACQGKDSEYYSWYDFKSFPDDYRCWWGFKDLPEVNENNPEWQNYVITGKNSVVKTWLRRGAAGWRLDVADELPDEALALIREAAKQEKPDALILGEVWEDAVIKESYGKRRNYALGYSLDSVMNYPFRNAVLAFFRWQLDAYGLRDFLIGQQMNYPRPMYYSLMNLLGTHDVERIRTALCVDFNIRDLSREQQVQLKFSQDALERAVETEKLCACIQFAVPGVPSIYYGDEQGMCGVCDPFNRLPFREGSKELHDCCAELAKIRNSAPALSTGEAVFMADNANVLMVLRYIRNNRDAFGLEAENGVYLAVINRGASDCAFTADCSAAGLGEYSNIIPARSGHIFRLA
jgi:glycosidase